MDTKGGKWWGDGHGGVMNWAIGIDMYTLMCIKLMTNENLLYKKIKENSEKTNNETEINNLPDKEFEALAIRMLPELKKIIDERRENFNKELEK